VSQLPTLPQNYYAVIMNAFWKISRGRRRVPAPAPEHYALTIKIIRLRLRAKYQGPSGNRPFQGQERDLRASAAKGLLDIAIRSTTELRRLADALEAIPAEPDARQMNIVTAYTLCDDYPPTLRELREKFIAMCGQQCWPADFSVRKTLAWLELPWAKGKRGRPGGSRSLIGNPRR